MELQSELACLNSAWERNRHDIDLVVDANEIADIVSNWTKILVKKLEEEESQRLLKLEKYPS